MTFEEILPVVKAGGKAQRQVWTGVPRWESVLELIHVEAADGSQVMPLLVVRAPDKVTVRPFAGANWDLLADDWEIVT